MLRTIIATLAVATTLVAVATPSHLIHSFTAPIKAKAHITLPKGRETKAMKAKDCTADCNQPSCAGTATCGACPLTTCGN